MINILPGILSLLQHVEELKQHPEHYRPPNCPNCGKAGVWHHGHYERKSDRGRKAHPSCNPVPIPRFFCRHCQKTHSVLPECIPPRRWYLWCLQQLVIIKLLSGTSVKAASHTYPPSRSTCRRWWQRLEEHFRRHQHTLRSFFSELGYCQRIHEFWSTCLTRMPFSRAMLLCHQQGVMIP